MLSAELQQSEMSMSGKTVLITGATSGLGLATALLLGACPSKAPGKA